MTSETKKTLFTPFNIFAGIVLLIGAYLTVMRFTGGLAAVTNLDDNNPWGIWIGFDLLCGVAGSASTCSAEWPWPRAASPPRPRCTSSA